MHVGVVLLVVAAHRVDDRPRLLRGRGVVEVDERLAVDALAEDGEVLAAPAPGRTPARSAAPRCSLRRSRRRAHHAASRSRAPAGSRAATSSFARRPERRRPDELHHLARERVDEEAARLAARARRASAGRRARSRRAGRPSPPWPHFTSSAKISSWGFVSTIASSESSRFEFIWSRDGLLRARAARGCARRRRRARGRRGCPCTSRSSCSAAPRARPRRSCPRAARRPPCRGRSTATLAALAGEARVELARARAAPPSESAWAARLDLRLLLRDHDSHVERAPRLVLQPHVLHHGALAEDELGDGVREVDARRRANSLGDASRWRPRPATTSVRGLASAATRRRTRGTRARRARPGRRPRGRWTKPPSSMSAALRATNACASARASRPRCGLDGLRRLDERVRQGRDDRARGERRRGGELGAEPAVHEDEPRPAHGRCAGEERLRAAPRRRRRRPAAPARDERSRAARGS